METNIPCEIPWCVATVVKPSSTMKSRVERYCIVHKHNRSIKPLTFPPAPPAETWPRTPWDND